MHWTKVLTPHGQSKDTCEMVVKNFDKPEYVNHQGVQIWVKASKECLKEKHNV
jgi:hypothetical protein